MIGETIKRIRKEAGLDQRAFSKAIQCNQSYLSRMEREFHLPSHGLATRILKFAKLHKIKIRIEDLFPE